MGDGELHSPGRNAHGVEQPEYIGIFIHLGKVTVTAGTWRHSKRS